MTNLLRAEPFVFFEEPPEWRAGWRWMSYSEVGRLMTHWRSSLEGLSPGDRVEITGSPSVGALAADLAVRMSGLCSVPLLENDEIGSPAVLEGVARRLDPRRDEIPLKPLTVPSADGARTQPVESPEDATRGGHATAPAEGACTVVETRGGQLVRGRLEAQTLVESSQRLDALIGREGRRHVIVHGQSLADSGERLVVDWAERTGAAIAVASAAAAEDSCLASAEAAAWVRPTVLHGRAQMLEQWVDLLLAAESGRRGVRRRFRRLTSVLVTDQRQLAPEAADFYRHLGAAVAVLPRAAGTAFDQL